MARIPPSIGYITSGDLPISNGHGGIPLHSDVKKRNTVQGNVEIDEKARPLHQSRISSFSSARLPSRSSGYDRSVCSGKRLFGSNNSREPDNKEHNEHSCANIDVKSRREVAQPVRKPQATAPGLNAGVSAKRARLGPSFTHTSSTERRGAEMQGQNVATNPEQATRQLQWNVSAGLYLNASEVAQSASSKAIPPSSNIRTPGLKTRASPNLQSLHTIHSILLTLSEDTKAQSERFDKLVSELDSRLETVLAKTRRLGTCGRSHNDNGNRSKRMKAASSSVCNVFTRNVVEFRHAVEKVSSGGTAHTLPTTVQGEAIGLYPGRAPTRSPSAYYTAQNTPSPVSVDFGDGNGNGDGSMRFEDLVDIGRWDHEDFFAIAIDDSTAGTGHGTVNPLDYGGLGRASSFDAVSLSSEVDSLPSSCRSSRAPTPASFYVTERDRYRRSSRSVRTLSSDEDEYRVNRPELEDLKSKIDASRLFASRRSLSAHGFNERQLCVSAEPQHDPAGEPEAKIELDKKNIAIADELLDDDDMDSDVGTERSLRGCSEVDRGILPASDGTRRAGGAKWWAVGENTIRSRMQEISCEMCRGRVHWACAGLSDRDGNEMLNEAWMCPDCVKLVNDRKLDNGDESVILAQRARCLRPNCVLRSKVPLKRKHGDTDFHFVDKILGQRAVSRRVNGARRYEYLIKYVDWEMYECTWQVAKDVSGFSEFEAEFKADCKDHGLNLRDKVVLLPETQLFWDENGDLKRDMLEELGVAPAEWWPEPRGKYRLLIA